MSTTMPPSQREAFLADLHVGVLSVAQSDGRPPLAVPIWYDYSPGGGVRVITARSSQKGIALERAGRYGIVAQTEDLPYLYVSVEGAVTESRRCELDRDLRPMAIRYLGKRQGDVYAEQWAASGSGEDWVYVMRPERWLSADLTADFEALAVR